MIFILTEHYYTGQSYTCHVQSYRNPMLQLSKGHKRGRERKAKRSTPAQFWGHYRREWLPFVPPWHLRGSLITQQKGQAEVSEERALHTGLWHGLDDTPSLKQWDAEGKNNIVLGGSRWYGRAGIYAAFFKRIVCAALLSHTHPTSRHPWDSLAWEHKAASSQLTV